MSRRSRFSSLILTLTLGCSVHSVNAQPKSTHPLPDDPELYAAFFHFHDDFSNWIDNRNAKNPVAAPKLLQGAAKYLHVAPADLQRIAIVTRAVAAQLRSVSAELTAYLDRIAKNHQQPDKATLQQLQTKRQQIIQPGINQLKQSLSLAGWNGLSGYINGEHRLSIQAFVAAPAPPPGSTN